MEKHKKREITVEKAAEELSVTPRTVINYIKSKEIEAVKVGKNWFISKASFDAFSRKHGFNKNSQREISGNFPENIPKKESEIKLEAKKETHSPTSGTSTDFHSIGNLRIFQKIKTVFDEEIIQNSEIKQSLSSRIKILSSEAVEFLGAGFYAFGTKNKVFYYNRSREKISSILALIYFNDTDVNLHLLAHKIEAEVMPMYSSLIKKIEQKIDKKN